MTPLRLTISFAVALVVTMPRPGHTVTPISAITDDAPSFANQHVTVIGTVTEQRLGYAGESFYTISGDDRRISVISRQAAPAVGAKLQLEATVGYKPGDDEFTWPPVLQETARQPAP